MLSLAKEWDQELQGKEGHPQDNKKKSKVW